VLPIVDFSCRWLPEVGLEATPYVHLIVLLLAVGLAPVHDHPARSHAAMLDIVACSLAFVAVEHPLGAAVLWTATTALTARELGAGHAPALARRTFARYHVPSLLLALAGGALADQQPGFAAVAWLLAIAVREATLPAHGWLPVLLSRAPLGLVVCFLAPQLGVLAHVRYVGADAGIAVEHALAALGGATALFAAALGLVQRDARRAAGCLVLSQTGLVFFGLENASDVGFAGAIAMSHATALGTSGFVMTIAALEARRGRLTLDRPGGSFARTPRMAVAFLVLGFASIGLPATLGFVAEDLLVQGSVSEYPALALVLVLATGLNGITVLRCFLTLFSGTEAHAGERDFTPREVLATSTAMAVLLLAGIGPGLVVHTAARHGPPPAPAAAPHVDPR
jgi:NADH-quinone oxidoreductase subunit M